MTLIIGLGHKARHGKDSFAQAIDSHFAIQHAAAAKHGLANYKPVVIQRLSFADALYREVNAAIKAAGGIETLLQQGIEGTPIPAWVTPDQCSEVSARAPYGKHSKLLQWWGSEFRRGQDSLYWVKQWKAAINPKANIVMAADMRFINEAEAVKSVGGFTVQVNRLNADGTPLVDPSRDSYHISETQLDNYNYDYRITVKTGDIALLEEWTITLVHYLRVLKGHK